MGSVLNLNVSGAASLVGCRRHDTIFPLLGHGKTLTRHIFIVSSCPMAYLQPLYWHYACRK